MRKKDSKLVNNEDFYNDFIKGIRAEINTVKNLLSKHRLNLEEILIDLSEKFHHIQGYYKINGNYNFTAKYLRDCLSDYQSVLKFNYVPITKVPNYIQSLLVNKLKTIKLVTYKIWIYEQELKGLEESNVDYKTYRDISIDFNEWNMRFALDGGAAVFAEKMGNVVVYNNFKNFKSNRCKIQVDHKRSNDYKKKLIEAGRIPFKKEDAELAAARGEEYKGEDWLIYNYDDSYLYIHWHKGNKIRTDDEGDKVYLKYYSFVPLRCDNLFKKQEDAIDMLTSCNDVNKLFECNLGFVNNLHILKKSIPGFTERYPNNLMSDDFKRR